MEWFGFGDSCELDQSTSYAVKCLNDRELISHKPPLPSSTEVAKLVYSGELFYCMIISYKITTAFTRLFNLCEDSG
jgi:hypothetical protein